MNTTAADSGPTLRTLILLVLAFGIVGVLAELVLIEHTEGRKQWVPLVTLVAGLIAVTLRLLRHSRLTERLMQGVMSVFVLTGVLGVYFHIEGNRAFELEIFPTMSGSELFWESMKGATPALAPGTMVLLGLIGLVACTGNAAATSISNREPS